MRSEGLVIGSAMMSRAHHAPIISLAVSSIVSLCHELVAS